MLTLHSPQPLRSPPCPSRQRTAQIIAGTLRFGSEPSQLILGCFNRRTTHMQWFLTIQTPSPLSWANIYAMAVGLASPSWMAVTAISTNVLEGSLNNSPSPFCTLELSILSPRVSSVASWMDSSGKRVRSTPDTNLGVIGPLQLMMYLRHSQGGEFRVGGGGEREIYFKSHIFWWEHSSHFRLIGRGVPSVSVVSLLVYKFLCLASPKENPQVPM